MAKFATMVREHGGTTSDMPHLPLSMLEPNPDNIRLDTDDLRAHIRSIADSIKETGYLRSRPLTVRFAGETAIVVDGNCRFAACQIAVAEGAELLTIPCVLEAPGTSAVERVANMVIANSGMQHSALEKVTAIKLMLSYGWTEVKIGQRLGVSRQTINNLLDLASASSDVQQMIAGGTISATQAIKLIRSEGENAGDVIAKVAEKAKAAGKTRVTAKAFRDEKIAPSANETTAPESNLLFTLRRVAKLSACWSDATAHELHAANLEAIDWEIHAMIAALGGAVA